MAENGLPNTRVQVSAVRRGGAGCWPHAVLETRTVPFLRTQLPSVGSRCVEYIWIRQPTELKQKKAAGADSGDLHQFKYTPLVSCSRPNHRHYHHSKLLVCIWCATAVNNRLETAFSADDAKELLLKLLTQQPELLKKLLE